MIHGLTDLKQRLDYMNWRLIGATLHAVRVELPVTELVREFNIRLGMPFVRKIGKSGLRELRIKHSSDLYRIFYFAYIGHKFVLLHAFLKKGTKTPESDKELAIKRMNNYKARY